jgi:hypothetical protein
MQPQFQPAFPSLSAVTSQYFMRRIVALLLSTQQQGTKQRRSSKAIQKRLRQVFPDLLASEFIKREAIGKGHEAVNYGSRARDWARLAFCVPTVHQRAFNAQG